MASRHICPKCGGKTFITSAVICQDWEVDKYGEYINVEKECTQVYARPDDGNVWECQ